MSTSPTATTAPLEGTPPRTECTYPETGPRYLARSDSDPSISITSRTSTAPFTSMEPSTCLTASGLGAPVLSFPPSALPGAGASSFFDRKKVRTN